MASADWRTAATSAALVIGMALVCAGATITASMRASVSSIVNDSMHADLYVRQATFSTRLIPIPPEMTAAIGRLDGVASTTAYAANLASVTGPDGKTSTGYVVAVDPGIEFKQFIGGNERSNLFYEVLEVSDDLKNRYIDELLHRELDHQDGGAVVFVARQKSAEKYAEFLKRQGWDCEYFHAELQANAKAKIQWSTW